MSINPNKQSNPLSILESFRAKVEQRIIQRLNKELFNKPIFFNAGIRETTHSSEILIRLNRAIHAANRAFHPVKSSQLHEKLTNYINCFSKIDQMISHLCQEILFDKKGLRDEMDAKGVADLGLWELDLMIDKVIKDFAEDESALLQEVIPSTDPSPVRTLGFTVRKAARKASTTTTATATAAAAAAQATPSSAASTPAWTTPAQASSVAGATQAAPTPPNLYYTVQQPSAASVAAAAAAAPAPTSSLHYSVAPTSYTAPSEGSSLHRSSTYPVLTLSEWRQTAPGFVVDVNRLNEVLRDINNPNPFPNIPRKDPNTKR